MSECGTCGGTRRHCPDPKCDGPCGACPPICECAGSPRTVCAEHERIVSVDDALVSEAVREIEKRGWVAHFYPLPKPGTWAMWGDIGDVEKKRIVMTADLPSALSAYKSSAGIEEAKS